MYEGVVSRAVALCKGGQMPFTLDHKYFTQSSYVESQYPTIAASAQCANAAASLADPSQFLQQVPSVPTRLQVSLIHHSFCSKCPVCQRGCNSR